MFALAIDEQFPEAFDDYSESLSKVRGRLVNSEGVRYADFVRGLGPVYWRVYLDIGLRYGAWFTTVLTCVAQARGFLRSSSCYRQPS